MKRSPFPITALSCLLIACLLPGHFTQILEEVAQARPLVSAQRTHAEVTEIKAEVPDISAKAPGINGNSLLSQREQEFDPLRFHQNKPLPKPTTPQNPPSKKIELPKSTDFRTKIQKYFAKVTPNFLQKFFQFLTKGLSYTSRRKPDWEEMDKDITEMIAALQKFTSEDLYTQAGTHRRIFELLYPELTPDHLQTADFAKVLLKKQEAEAKRYQQNKLSGALPEPLKDPQLLMTQARDELENLGGFNSVFRSRKKERQMLYVKSLVELSRHEKFSKDALSTIDTIIRNLRLRENPADRPRILKYLIAAQYVMTFPHESLEELPAHLARQPAWGILENLLKKQTLNDWLNFFKQQDNKFVSSLYQNMIAGRLSGQETFKVIGEWSLAVINPTHSKMNIPIHNQLFALETLHMLSSVKPVEFGGSNPAFEGLIATRNAWRQGNSDNEVLPAMIERTAESALKTRITTINEEEFRLLIAQHKNAPTSPETEPTSPKTEPTSIKTEPTPPKTESTPPNTESTPPKAESTSPKKDLASPKTAATSPKTEPTSPKTDAEPSKKDESHTTSHEAQHQQS
ncbi:hypothetical protein PCANC_00975 [Puccinia coronata f. sp. avenae]|uniref:Uncharacterized protein n=1 Tax=Puccinia coronata f. sp. avenae TaxID=200324 RepID=A0A2N5W6K1_9BASI|nr:hypothetical protein PCANC_03997 [Puccinia coronata f. sp. avenae]PLW57871.1 hypothetical protein PCANC_00975 [Puccinia coronata f. sp. avenae]